MKSGYEAFFKQVRKNAGSAPQTRVRLKATPKPSSTAPATKKMGLVPRRANKHSLPWRGLVISALGLALSLWYMASPKTFEPLVSRVEIRLFGTAGAAEEEKSAATEKPKEAHSAETKVSKDKADGLTDTNKKDWTTEEMSFFSKLNERKRELDMREAELNKLEEELQQQKADLEKRMQQLTQLRAQIADVLKNQVEVDKEKVDKLVEFYSNMKPQQAAKIIETLNEDLAVETLGRMKKKNAAEIMNLLEAKKAQSLSEKLAGYKHK